MAGSFTRVLKDLSDLRVPTVESWDSDLRVPTLESWDIDLRSQPLSPGIVI